MKKKQNGFALLEGLLIVSILVLLGFAGWTVYKKHKQGVKVPQGISKSVNEETITAGEGTQVIKMLPGRTIVKLPSGDILSFRNTGSATSVPDFIFGANYTLNDIHNINYLPIKKVLTTYNKGYRYALANKGCQTKREFDIDVEITVVTDCTIEVQVAKTNPPNISSASLTKPLSITEKQGGPLRSVLSSDPYLFVGATNIRVTKTTYGTNVYSDSGDWEVNIITNFGIETVKYTAEELYAQQTKSVTIGSSKVDVIIDALTCTPAYSPASGCKNQNAAVYDKINFTVKYSLASTNKDVKIIDYQE